MQQIPDSPFPPGYIVTPTGVVPRFLEFYDALEVLEVPMGTGRSRNSGPDCDSNRNRAIREILAKEDGTLEWIAFLDDDHTFPPDQLMRMLSALYEHNLPVLSALYTRKIPPFEPVWFQLIGTDGGKDRLTMEDLTYARQQGDIIPVDGVGGGFLLVRKEVFKQVEDPWFNPGPGRSFGGDIGFGIKLKKLGIKTYGMMDGIGHVMPATVTPVWNKAEKKWQLHFLFGTKGFAIDYPALAADVADAEDQNTNTVC